jgi:hypothetical protein
VAARGQAVDDPEHLGSRRTGTQSDATTESARVPRDGSEEGDDDER